MVAIVASGLSKRYGHSGPPIHPPWVHPPPEVRALEDLSIEVRDGEIFGFLGPNGAGKSTTIRLLLGFLHPSAGSASVLGLDVVRDSVEIRRRTGYLPGGIALYDTMSGEDLLDYLGDLTGRPPARRQDLCDRLEMPPATLRRQVRDYSRGMRQKMGIIQALQHDPELAILDEPTEGLDPLMQRAFYAILDDLQAAGRTIFFSSHVLSEVERVCDRVAIVRRGRLAALEDVDALLARRKRNVEMRVDGATPALDGVPGVLAVEVLPDGQITCQLEGDVGPFLAAIRDVRVVDLTIEPAHLEEAFLELYHDEEGESQGEGPAAVPTTKERST
jgi:ABC-2 type transport system ATP-binding protein